MMGVPELIGGSLGTMIGNPIILIAGFVVSRTSPAKPRFWIELVLAAIVCTALQFSFDKGLSDLPSRFGLGEWFALVGLGTVWATTILLLLRILKSALTPRKAV
jgi:hypothetical protein